VVAEVLTVRVEVPAPLATEGGTKEQVGAGVTTGVIVQVKLTVPLKAFVGATVMVEADVPPAGTEAGESAEPATVKSGTGAAATVRPTDASWLRVPKAPVTVTFEVPAGVATVVVMVRVEVTAAAPAVTVGGTNAQLDPRGSPVEQVNVTSLLKPANALTEMVYVAGWPAVTDAVVGGVTLTLKSGIAPDC
jgi:hypothetical protein